MFYVESGQLVCESQANFCCLEETIIFIFGFSLSKAFFPLFILSSFSVFYKNIELLLIGGFFFFTPASKVPEKCYLALMC